MITLEFDDYDWHGYGWELLETDTVIFGPRAFDMFYGVLEESFELWMCETFRDWSVRNYFS